MVNKYLKSQCSLCLDRSKDYFSLLDRLRILLRREVKKFSPLIFSGLNNLEKLSLRKQPIDPLSLTSNPSDEYFDLMSYFEINIYLENPLLALLNLKYLDISGTKVKSLNGISKLSYLTVLDISNTKIKQLFPLYSLSLKKLFIGRCVKLSTEEINEFKEYNPNCEVFNSISHYESWEEANNNNFLPMIEP
jgi:hypothetical protein